MNQDEGRMIEDEAYERFTELCTDLNLDSMTKDNTWRTFATVRQKYTLEGETGHWLCCAVYVACRQANLPSVGATPTPVTHGSYVNLTRLLRTSKLSLVDFFDKSRKWGDMTNMNQDFRSKIERLERNFAVTTVIFKKFEPIFCGLFKDFSRSTMDESRSSRKKLTPKSAADLFEFCWTLFLCVKSSLRISDDLVNSYHLLLACTDLVFHNVVIACRNNLLTPKFVELAEAGGDPRSNNDPTCIIHALCDLYDGVSVEAKTIKEFWLKPKIRQMIDGGMLRGDGETLSGLIDDDVFENNYRKLEKEYEEYVLTEGDFDERMYLSPEKQDDFGMNSSSIDFLKSLECPSPYRACPPVQELRHLMPATPLTGKKYLAEKEENSQCPISQATQSVSLLQAMLSGRKAEPSATLKDILAGCIRDPIPGIVERVKRLSEVFCEQYSTNKKGEIQPGLFLEFAHYRSQLSQTLYFRLLENILGQEVKQIKSDKAELTEIMFDDAFHTSLFALCMEIVLFSFNSVRRFPWILETFGLAGYHFFKVIEIVVRTEENLSRDVVKHLSQIEEKVLEELAWEGESPLWTNLAAKSEPIPSCEEVFLPSQMDKNGDNQAENAPKRYAVIKTPQGEKCVPVAVGGSNQSTLIIQDKTSSQILGVVLPSKHGDKPKKGSSVALFFRKFYHLSFVRLQDLCKNLSIDDDTLRKIWTCFQQSIVNHLEDLMRSRHLDQIIMCVVYVVAKVVGTARTFTDIMRCYRLQPQSASHVYRNVLLNQPEERGDLIKFYNTIFIGGIQKYALKFSSRAEDTNVPLSPVPHLKATPLSPCRKMLSKHSVFVRPLRAPKTPSPTKQLRFSFATRGSPASNLKAINTMVQMSDTKPKAVKRLITEEEGTALGVEQVPNKVFARRLQDYIEERPGVIAPTSLITSSSTDTILMTE